MKVSTSINVMFRPEPGSASAAVERLAAIGFGRLDLNLCDWCYAGSPFVGDDWEGWIGELGEGAAQVGVRFTQSHGPIFPKFEDTDRCRELTALSHRAIRAAGKLAIPWIVFEPGSLAGAFDASHLGKLRQRNLDWFGALLRTAEREGVGLALENVNDLAARGLGARRHYGSIPAELVDLVDGFGSTRVGICWDTGHAHIQRLDQPAALRALGTRLQALHVQDNNGESDQHLLPYAVPPGQGIDWPPLVSALREIAYAGDFTLEVAQAIRPQPEALWDSAMRHALEVARDLVAPHAV